MPTLLLINGLPGTGKSTLARRFVDDRPLALCLEIDVVRGLLGAWADYPADAGQLARRLGLAMADSAFEHGHDVVVPQFLGRVEFIRELESAAQQHGALFVEVALVEDLDTTLARLARRAAEPMTPAQRDAHALLDRDGGARRAIPEMHDLLQDVLAARPNTRRVTPVPDDLDQTYHRLVDSL